MRAKLRVWVVKGSAAERRMIADSNLFIALRWRRAVSQRLHMWAAADQGHTLSEAASPAVFAEQRV